MWYLRDAECKVEDPDSWRDDQGSVWCAMTNRVYVDTPGLFDTTRIKQAAQEIEESLKLGGEYKIIFVVQLKQVE